MPLDAVVLSAVRAELETRLINARIDKVFQPEKDEVVLLLRGIGENLRLLISASQNNARIHVTEYQKENPQTPPMFCMLIRKYLMGGVIREIRQPPLERLLEIGVDAPDEMGLICRRRLVLELIGRQSNLILLDGEGRIIDSLRRVDADVSSKRQVLPGMFYRLPPAQEKQNPLDVPIASLSGSIAAAPPETGADQWLLDTFFGISPLVAREITARASGEPSARFAEMSPEAKARYLEEAEKLFQLIQTNRCEPYMLLDQGEPKDMSYFPITQYGDRFELKRYASFSEMIEAFYSERDRAARMHQRTYELKKSISSALERTKRKLGQQRLEWEAAKTRDRLRESGDLLMANLHVIRKGQKSVTVTDFYDAEGGDTEITLDPKLSAQQNAAKYYKDYNRMKNAERILTDQIASGEHEVKYLESVLDELTRAESDRDLRDIREELQGTGYLRADRSAGKKKETKKQTELRPREFRSSSGLTILAGRNNLQNDRLTLREAHKNDIWFHTQKFAGSHVILRCEGEEPDDAAYTEAAMIAAYYSQAQDGHNVPVDYTRIRYVKKPNGAKPGMVIYDPYFTAYATPDPAQIEALRVK